MTTPTPSAPLFSLDRVVGAARAAGLKVRQRGQHEFQMSCPVHEDRNPSLSVAWKQGTRGGMTVLHCHGCQARPEDIAAALGLAMTDLFDEPPQRQRTPVDLVSRSSRARRSGKRRSRRGPLPKRIAGEASAPRVDEPAPAWTVVETYPYVTGDGELVLEVTRQERVWPDGRREKNFPQRFHVDGRAQDRKPPGFAPVLYRHPDVVAAVAAGRAIWLCEGEKDVHTAEALGLVATTNAQGSGGFPAELAAVFTGADVRVVLDRDLAGFKRALQIHGLLDGVAARVQLLLPAPTAPKSDLTDHVQAGFGVDELVAVTADDVAAWAATGECQAVRTQVGQALQETWAQTAAAGAASTKKARTQHTSNAQRWALEAEIRLERLAPKVELAQHLARKADTRWAARAGVVAAELYGEAVADAREAFQTVGLPLPPALATSPPTIHTAAAAADPADDPRPGPVHARTAVFRIENGAVCEVVAGKDGQADHLKTLLELDVRVKTYHVRERPEHIPITGPDGADETTGGQADARRTLVAVTLACTDPTSGEALEWRVTADEWNSGTWLNDLPGRPPFDRRRTGRDRLTQAINYVSAGAAETAVYRVTGWRDDGFVTAGGLVHPDGMGEADVVMSGALNRYRLPEPTRDVDELRAAFTGASGTHWLQVLPARVAAPLLGQVYRSALGQIPTSLVLYGLASTKKTSIASLTMHHWGTGWERNSATGMDKTGDTVNARRILMSRAKDVLFWLDDVNPDHGVEQARENLDNVIRQVYNRLGRSRSDRAGEEVSEPTPALASVLITSEFPPTQGSARERAVLVPMVRGEIDLETLLALDEGDSRRARARLMSSMLAWLASRRVEVTQGVREEETRYFLEHYRAGWHEREAEGLSYLWGGWVLMTMFLRDVGALTDQERHDILEEVRGHLEQAREVVQRPDLPSTKGAALLDMLRQALASRLAYVQDARTGQDPPEPWDTLLGWERQQTGMETPAGEPKYRTAARGKLLGYVLHDPGPRDAGPELWLFPQQVEILLKDIASKQVGGNPLGLEAIFDNLHAEQALVVERRPNGSTCHTAKRTVHCQGKTRQRFMVIPLHRVLGADTDDAPDGPTGGDSPPQPVPAPAEDTTNNTAVGATEEVADSTPGLNGDGDLDQSGREEEPVARGLPDAEGTLVVPQMIPDKATEPCLVCGAGACFRFDGVAMHVPCWQASTSASRTARIPPAGAAVAASPSVGPSAPTPDRPTATAAPARQAAVVVADTDGVWLPDGTRLPPPDPLTHVGHLAELVERLGLGAQVTRRWSEPGQVWVTAALAGRLGFDVEAIGQAEPHQLAEAVASATRDRPALSEAVTDGWSIGGGGQALRAFTRIWRGQQRAPWLVLLPAVAGVTGNLPMLRDDPDPGELARRLQLFADTVGAPWKVSHGATGLDLLTTLRFADRERMLAPSDPVPPATVPGAERDISWSRVPTESEQQLRYVHAYDRGGSYLAAASLELGIGAPTHHPDGLDFDPRTAPPGYWRIEIPPAADWRHPHPLSPTPAIPAGPRWVTTPTLRMGYELGYDVPVLEAYIWAEHGRVLEPWYKRLRDARADLDVDDPGAQAVRDTVKLVTVATLGLMASDTHLKGRPGYAPERWHHIVAQARANLLRRIMQIGTSTGQWPVAAVTDTIVYASDEPDPAKAWPGLAKHYGRGLGQLKWEGSGLLADHLPVLTGRGYNPAPGGQQLLRTDWDPDEHR